MWYIFIRFNNEIIKNIREKIEDDPGQPLYIQTVRGVGYRFNGNLGSE